jgi:hypothetical protein
MEIIYVRDIIAVLRGIVGLVALFKGIVEYKQQGTQKRSEYFIEMRKRLKENQSFKTIAELLETDSIELTDIPFKEKRDYLGLFEEVAMMMNSNLIRKEVAHYMFGYYAIRCWESKHFWKDVNRESIYWKLFRNFVIEMKDFENDFEFSIKKYKF